MIYEKTDFAYSRAYTCFESLHGCFCGGTVSYVNPDPGWDRGANNKIANTIGVNQGSIKVVYTEAVTEEELDNISFYKTDTKNEPVGGVYKSLSSDGLTVTVSFGELEENTTAGTNGYTLQVGSQTWNWGTFKKLIAEEDFDDMAVGALDGSSNDGKAIKSDSAVHVSGSDVKIVEDATGKALRLTTSASGNHSVGVKLADQLGFAKVVQDVKFKAIAGTNQGCSFKLGNISHYMLNNSRNNQGYALNNFVSNITQDDDGYYNIIIENDRTESIPTELNGKDSKFDFYNHVRFYDGNNTAVTVAQWDYSLKNVVNNDDKMHFAGAFMGNSTNGDSIELTYYRAGFFVYPKVLGNVGFSGNTATVTVSTDVDEASLKNITAKNVATGADIAASATYDDSSRCILVALTGDVPSAENISINLSGVVSADGYKGLGVVSCSQTEAVDVDYITPSDVWNTGNHVADIIGPNQGEIKITYKNNVNAGQYSFISFYETATGKEPAGGVYMSMEGDKTVVVKFGELKENTGYTLSVNGVAYGYTTTGKLIVEDDFDGENWTSLPADASIIGSSVSGHGSLNSLTGNSKIYWWNGSSAISWEKSGDDGYLKAQTLSGDSSISIMLPRELIFSKVINDVKIKVDAGADNKIGDQLGMAFVSAWLPGNARNGSAGVSFKSYVANKGFSTDASEYYDLIMDVDQRTSVPKNTPVKNSAAGVNTTKTKKVTTFYDNIGGGTSQRVYTLDIDFTNESTDGIGIYKSYMAGSGEADDSIYITSLRSGFYTLPEVMGTAVCKDGVAEIIVNTDLDTATLSGITATGANGALTADASYDAATRKLSVEISGDVSKGDSVDISLDGVKSVDGYKLSGTETVTYDKEAVSYAVSASAGEGGSVTVNGAASATVEAGETVDVVITPDEGYQTKSIKVNDADYSLASDSFSLEINEETSIEVTFVKKDEFAGIDGSAISGGDFVAYENNYVPEGETEGCTSVVSYYKITIPKGWTISKAGVLFGGLDLESKAEALTDGAFGIRVYGAAIVPGLTVESQGYVQFAESDSTYKTEARTLNVPQK